MYPIIADLGRIKLYSYGLTLFVAFILGIWIANKRGKSAGLADGVVLDFSTAIILSGILGARILYVLTHLEDFRGRWLDVVNPIQSDGSIGIAGLVLLGGVVAAAATLVFMTWLKDVSVLKILDVFAPSLALGIAIGRIGCYFNGCCFGVPTDLPWAVIFPQSCPAGSIFPHDAIHPTQIYAVIYGTILYFTMLWAEKKFKTGDGFTFGIFMIGYGILRFSNETLRWHESGLRAMEWQGGMLTFSQLISITMVLAGLGLISYVVKRVAGTTKSHPRSTS